MPIPCVPNAGWKTVVKDDDDDNDDVGAKESRWTVRPATRVPSKQKTCWILHDPVDESKEVVVEVSDDDCAAAMASSSSSLAGRRPTIQDQLMHQTT